MKNLPYNVIHKKLNELGINFLNIDFDTPPEEITYEMLEGAMNKNSLDFVADRKTLWRAWSRIMMNPHPFGMYHEENLMDKNKRKQFLKYCEQIKIKYIDKNKIKPIKQKSLRNQKYASQIPMSVVAVPAAGGSFLKRTKTKNRNKHKKSMKTKRKKYYGGRHNDFAPDNEPSFFIRPIPRENYNYENNNPMLGVFQTLIESTILPGLFAMQIPHQFNILSMKEMFMYLMYNKDIDYLIDLHACNVPNSNQPHQSLPTRGCNPNALSIERDTWEEVKNIYADTRSNTNIDSVHIPYLDMTAGSNDVWGQIANLPDVSIRRSVVHCLAGYGRTASVLVFLTIRDHPQFQTQVRQNINVPYWGAPTIDWERTILGMIPHEHGRKEFWDVRTVESKTRLCYRLNYIIGHLALLWGETDVVAYSIDPNTQMINPVSVPTNILISSLL
jgi:hypothetical protein